MPTHHLPEPAAARPQRTISKSLLFLSITLAIVVGFVAGTRSNELLGAIAPLVGIKVATGTINLDRVQTTYQQLKANYDGTLDEQALIDGASRGLVAAADDRYTVFMDTKEAGDFDKDLSGEIGGGIGVELGMRNEQPTVIRVLEGNPAEKAGLKAGDTIVTINGQSAVGWDTAKVAEKIRGEVGTTVKIVVDRSGEAKEFTITRATVNNPSVQSRVENGIGIMKLTRFDENTSTLAKKAAESFKQQNVKGVILDLRGNGGGYVEAAQAVAGLWIDNKVIVSERTNGKVTDELKSTSNPVLKGIKTIVLVDGDSASASEIVAGALQDYGVATLVGQKTFGKGTVQKVLDLGAGTKLKVTVARWYTPKGKNITKDGIKPDVSATLTKEDINAGIDPQLDAALKLFL
ncbi:MAG: putative carboxyl-terminal protease [Candidatus Saccharibacteria bacterium]|nr:putative carboxyl-terminal protease [Candidatus Saccharibacteria bacterium]